MSDSHKLDIDCTDPELKSQLDALAAMTPEQLTMFLARNGVSPEDTRRSLEKAMKMVEDFEKAQSK